MHHLATGMAAGACACFALASISTPAFGQAYAFPFWSDDLPAGVRITTFTHKAGIQALGKDIGAMRYVGKGKWSPYVSGASKKKNRVKDFVVYGLPFHAMADGEVIGCWRRAPENTPGSLHAEREAPGVRIIGGGNHLWIRQDDGRIALYAHAVPDSIPSSLCPKMREFTRKQVAPASGNPDVAPQAYVPEGVPPSIATGTRIKLFDREVVVRRPRVRRDQYLGRVGNSGASSGGPHLHIHVENVSGSKSVAQLMRFARGLWGRRRGTLGDINDWRSFAGNKVPDGQVFIWPARRLLGEYARHRFTPGEYGRMFKHLFDSGYAPTWFDGYKVGSKTYFNFVWHPQTKPTRAWWGLTARSYQKNMNDSIADGYAPVFVESYRSGKGVRYALIMHKGARGAYLAKHGLTTAQNQRWFEKAKQQRLNPVNVSVVSVNGRLQHTALYRSDNIGSWVVKPKVKKGDYQALVNQQNAQGRRPRYIAAYKHQDEVYYSVVFASSYKDAVARHNLSAQKYQSEFGNQTRPGRLTRVITGVDGAKGKHEYAAVWKKGPPRRKR